MTKPMHIPQIGETFELAESWSFHLYAEGRNNSLVKEMGLDKATMIAFNGFYCWLVTLPAGWELKVARVYIRRGKVDYNSVTFASSYNGKRVRFWVKLCDANKIVMEDPSFDG